MRYSRVQRLILGAIEEWNQTICKTSRYKEDLGFIRDMHRLLTYKGYVFPEVKPEDASVLTPSDNLKSIEELQKEEQVAHSAKLQELVRRGRPQDLKEANKLMKIMAGFKDDSIVETRAKIAEDLEKLKHKAEVFDEMLRQPFDSNETVVELYSSLKVAQPKIQKLIEEEQDDPKAVQDLLKLNDTVNTLVEKFNQLKGNASGSSASNDLNLIDFDDDSSPAPQGQQQGSNVDDLLGDLNSLSFNYGQGGDITLSSPSPQPQPQQSGPNYDIFAQLNQPQSSQPTTTTTTAASVDFFGDFSPAPVQQQHQQSIQLQQRTLVNESQHLKFELQITRESPNSVKAHAFFSNVQSFPINNLQFLIAVPKTLQLRLEPQTGSSIQSFAKDSVQQVFRIDGQGSLKIKWKLNYTVNGTPVEETSTFTLPSV
jgi:hypothetical protein